MWWRIMHLCATASYQGRSATRMSTRAVADLALGKALPPWHGCCVLSLRHAYAPLYEQSWNRRATTCLKPRTALKGSRLLTWRSRKASCWTSGLSSSGDMGPA